MAPAPTPTSVDRCVMGEPPTKTLGSFPTTEPIAYSGHPWAVVPAFLVQHKGVRVHVEGHMSSPPGHYPLGLPVLFLH